MYIAVFNQTTYIYGMQPLVPNEVGLIFPTANHMLLFKGNRYHGVMHVSIPIYKYIHFIYIHFMYLWVYIYRNH